MNIKKGLVLLFALVLVLNVGCSNKENVSEKTKEAVKKTEEEKSEKISEGGRIILSVGDDPKVLHPFYATDRSTMTINNGLFDPLFVKDGEDIRYYLAENVSISDDNLIYTIKLKDNLKWHDGENLTADDLVFTFEKVVDEKQNANSYQNFIIGGEPVKVEKVDNLTVKLVLNKVSVPFLSTISGLAPIPKHIFEGEENFEKSEKNQKPIGSGPFKIKEWKKGESVVLERFDDYHGGKPHLDEVVFRIISDPNSEKVAFENGEISTRYIDFETYEKYEKEGNFNVFGFDEGMLNYMAFKLNSEALKDKKVRQAIAYGMDKEELINGGYNSTKYAEPAYTVLASDTLYYTEDVEHYDYNAEKAKKLLKEAGVENIKLTLGYINDSKEQQNQALVIQQRLEEIGIEIKLLALERGAFYQKLLDPSSTDFDLVFNGYVMGQEPDSYKLIFTKEGPYNFAQYENVELDKKWEEAAIEVNEEKRKTMYEEIQKEIMDDMIQYPICYPKALVSVDKKVGGIEEAKTVPIFMFEDLSKLYLTE